MNQAVDKLHVCECVCVCVREMPTKATCTKLQANTISQHMYIYPSTNTLPTLHNIIIFAYHSSCDVLDILDAELAFLELSISENVSPVAPAVDQQPLFHL